MLDLASIMPYFMLCLTIFLLLGVIGCIVIIFSSILSSDFGKRLNRDKFPLPRRRSSDRLTSERYQEHKEHTDNHSDNPEI